MKTEESLSDKVIKDCDLSFPVIDVEDLKESIKRIKEIIKDSLLITRTAEHEVELILNKEFGRKLI